MNNNLQNTTKKTFNPIYESLDLSTKPSLFTKLFLSKDNKVIKAKVFETKKEWSTWEKSVNEELQKQRDLSSKYPDKILKILNFKLEITNHRRNLYITYDCGPEAEPLLQYLKNNTVNFSEQAQIFEQLLQITCILYKSPFEHTNLKPNNILYYKKQVLLTDFGSARTHYQNFLKEYTSQPEKEWQNILIFYYPEQYQKIMEQDNLDFRNDSWQEFDISNQQFRKSIDIWGLSMMMIQVFENNQIFPNKITDFYGLNNQLLLKKIENLKQLGVGIFSQAVYSLLIEKQEPIKVYEAFIQQKQVVKTESSQTESTLIIKQIFDHDNEDHHIYSRYKPDSYFLSKQQIEDLNNQCNDDASSFRSTNQVIDNFTYDTIQRQKHNLTVVPYQLPPSRNHSATSRQKPQTYIFESSRHNPLNLDPSINEPKQTQPNSNKPNLTVTNYDLVSQYHQGTPIVDTQKKGSDLTPIQSQLMIIPVDINANPQRNLTQIRDDQQREVNNIEQLRNNNFDKHILQIIELDQIEENKSEIDPNQVFPSRQNQNEFSQFQFFDAKKIQVVNDADKNHSNDLISLSNSQQLIHFENEEQNSDQIGKNEGQQFNLLAIDDFEGNGSNTQNGFKVQQEIIQINEQGLTLTQINNPNIVNQNQTRYPQQKQSLIIISTKENQAIPQNDDEISGSIQFPSKISQEQNQFRTGSNKYFDSQYDDNQKLLIEIPEKDDSENKEQDGKKDTYVLDIFENDQRYQPIKQIQDPEVIYNENNNDKQLPFSINIIKGKLNEGVTQLQEDDQKQILNELKIIQIIVQQLVQNNIVSNEIFDDVEDNNELKKKQKQLIVDEIVKENEKDKLKLIQDVKDGIKFILRKQHVDKIFNQYQIEDNPDLLNILNTEQLKQLKDTLKNKQPITTKIQQIIDVKEILNKLKLNQNIQNILKNENQVGLLNEEELKIYKNLLDKIPKDKRHGNKILSQQSAIDKKFNGIKNLDEEEVLKMKFIDFLRNPSYENLLSDDSLKKLNEDERQKYKAILEELYPKMKQRQKKTIQDQINIINERNQNQYQKLQKIEEEEQDEQENTKKSSQQVSINQFESNMQQSVKEVDKYEVFSNNRTIKRFQQYSEYYQILEMIPVDCQSYMQQNKNRKDLKCEIQGSFYYGQAFNDQPDGIGILRKNRVSSIYKGYFKQGNFFWGQVLEMNDQGCLTQYVGYYDQKYQQKNGKAILKWFKIQNIGLCNGYIFQQYEQYEGNFVLGYIHGRGKKIFNDKSEYQGEWKKNKKQGQGIFVTMKDGKPSITYDGQFQDDTLNGQNIKAIHHIKPGLDLIVQGEYRNGKPIGKHNLIFNDMIQRQIDY